MRTYAEYLATMTVKTLNTIARDMGLKGYSKLRKAELIKFIDDAIVVDYVARTEAYYSMVAAEAGFLSTEAAADHDTIAALIAEVAVAPIEFSDPTPTVQAAPIVAQEASQADSLADLKDAYRNMRATVNRMGARGAEGMRRVKYVGMLRNLSAQLKGYGIKNPALL